MAHNQLNYLQEVKHVQELTQQKIDEYVFITYKQVWRLLRKEKHFFKGYPTYLRYINEGQVKQRIEELQT
jgi:acyl-ACP thioesterase